MSAVVRAAGGVVLRDTGVGEHVLLVHRSRYDDWTFPKGKVEGDETDEACALREVWEETNLRCTLGWELPSVSYHDRRGRSKVVRYWAMTAVKGEAEPRNEIAAVRWLGIEAALSLLTYQRDRELLAVFAAQPSPIAT